jgi:chorismate lyase/3-hydroxybenzoate synthase
LLTAEIRDAASLSAPALIHAVAAHYRQLASQLAARRLHAIRIRNFVPDIQGPMEDGDRYMAFNQGRFEAYSDWFGDPEGFGAKLPTASGVGACADDLSIAVLASVAAGEPVENPRQVPAYHYSRRYGMRPPCFARATQLGQTLLIGGTASIIGEDSRHMDCVETQTRETFRNITTLIASARHGNSSAALQALTDLRIHVLRAADAAAVHAILTEVSPHLTDVEYVEAQLCRKELLVEIEGRALI